MGESFLSPSHSCPAQQIPKSPLRVQAGGHVAYAVVSQVIFFPQIEPHSCEVMHRTYGNTWALTFCPFASMGDNKSSGS